MFCFAETELVNEKNKALDALTKEHRKHIQVIVEANKKEMEVRVLESNASNHYRLKILCRKSPRVMRRDSSY